MASAGQLIHPLVSYFPIFEAGINQLYGLFVVGDGDDDEVLDKGLSFFQRLSDLQFAVRGIEEIVDILHVDLHERNADTPFIWIFC